MSINGNRLASLPDSLPKIDFEAYKKQLPNPAALAALEKGVKFVYFVYLVRK